MMTAEQKYSQAVIPHFTFALLQNVSYYCACTANHNF